MEPAEKRSAQIEVIPARPEQEPILANLLELYAHDFSEFHDLELGPDGRFGYLGLPLYWSESGRHPFLVWVGGKLAGLISPGTPRPKTLGLSRVSNFDDFQP